MYNQTSEVHLTLLFNKDHTLRIVPQRVFQHDVIFLHRRLVSLELFPHLNHRTLDEKVSILDDNNKPQFEGEYLQ